MSEQPSIFTGRNRKEGTLVEGGSCPPERQPTKVNAQPLSEAQVAQLVRIEAGKFPKVGK